MFGQDKNVPLSHPSGRSKRWQSRKLANYETRQSYPKIWIPALHRALQTFSLSAVLRVLSIKRHWKPVNTCTDHLCVKDSVKNLRNTVKTEFQLLKTNNNNNNKTIWKKVKQISWGPNHVRSSKEATRIHCLRICSHFSPHRTEC